MAGGALRLDNSGSQIGTAASALAKAFTGDAAEEARAGYYGSEVALNRQKLEDLRRQATGRSSLQDALSGNVTGAPLLGSLAFSPEYLALAPKLNLTTSTLQPGATAQTPGVQMAQIGSGEAYTNTYGGTQDELRNRLAQSSIAAGPGYAAVAQRREAEGLEPIRVMGKDGNEIEVPRSEWRAHPQLYGAALSSPQVSQRSFDRGELRVGQKQPDGSIVEVMRPREEIYANPDKYTAPLASPQVEQQNVARQDNQWWQTGVPMRDARTGQPAYPTRRQIADAPPGSFIPPLTEAEVSQQKNAAEDRTAGQAAYKVDKETSENLRNTVIQNLNAMAGLTVRADGTGGFGTDVALPPGINMQKILADATTRFQLHGNPALAVQEALSAEVGSNPVFKRGGMFGGGSTMSTYQPGGTTPLPETPRNERGEVVRAPLTSTRRPVAPLPAPAPINTAPVAPVPPAVAAAAAAVPTAATAPAAQTDLPPEQKLSISRNLAGSTPDKAKASAKKLIQQNPAVRDSVIRMLKEHNIDTAGL